METRAIVLEEPQKLALRTVALAAEAEGDVTVSVSHTGISAGTERLLWRGEMPSFPGMGYPLVPGYETVGRVVHPGASRFTPGEAVFVPGARCYRDVKPLFGGAAKTVFASADKLIPIPDDGPQMTLLALAATARHAITVAGAPDLVVGHGVLGRLIARVSIALGNPAPTVHEVREERESTSEYDVAHPSEYDVAHPDADTRRDYRAIIDASGDHDIIDKSVARLSKGGAVTLAGFYGARMSFAFPAAFMREASIKIAAEWAADDMASVLWLIDEGALDLSGLISHRASPNEAADAYATAFTDPTCLKMVLDWESVH